MKFFQKFPVLAVAVGLATAWATGGLSFAMVAGKLSVEMTFWGAVTAGAVTGGLTGGVKGAITGAIAGAVGWQIAGLSELGLAGKSANAERAANRMMPRCARPFRRRRAYLFGLAVWALRLGTAPSS